MTAPIPVPVTAPRMLEAVAAGGPYVVAARSGYHPATLEVRTSWYVEAGTSVILGPMPTAERAAEVAATLEAAAEVTP